jgi:hypothetical protein
MNRGLVQSSNVNEDQRGLSMDESGRYGKLARIMTTYRGITFLSRDRW